MTNLLLLAVLTMSPKVASQQPQQIKTQAVAQQPYVTPFTWRNKPSLVIKSNLVAVFNPTNGQFLQSILLAPTNQVLITAPSNSVKVMVAAIGADGAVSEFTAPVANMVQPPQLQTNIYALSLLFSPDLKTWTTIYEMDFTNSLGTNSSGWWRTKLGVK